MSEEGEELAEVETVPDTSLPLVYQEGRVDFNYPTGVLSLQGQSGQPVHLQIILVSQFEGKTLVTIPFSGWHRLRAQRMVPPDTLTKATLVEVVVAEPDDRHAVSPIENSLKVWVGFLKPSLVPTILFPEEGEDLDEDTLLFSPDGSLGIYPFAEGLVEVCQEHFAFFTAVEHPAPEPGKVDVSGSHDLQSRVLQLEETMATVTTGIQELIQMQKTQAAKLPQLPFTAAPPAEQISKPKVKASPVQKGAMATAEFPLLDQAVVRAAQQAGVADSALQEMQALMASAGKARTVREPRLPPKVKAGPLSESDEEPDADAAGSGDLEPAASSDPMMKALGKLTDIMDVLTAEKRKKKSTLEAALDGVHGGGSESVGSGAGKRSAIARRALMKSLTASPHEISRNIEKLMMEDLAGRTRTPGMPEPALSARAWVEHRSFIGAYKTLAHAAWGISGVLDCLMIDRVEEARARSCLLLLQMDQAAADRGSWQMAATLSLEAPPPFAVLAQHHPPDVSMGDPPFSKLLDPRWSEVALAHLRDTEDYLDKRRKLQKGGKKEDTASGDDAQPKRKAKARPKRNAGDGTQMDA